jgi:transcriptional regulator NrdR family protein
MIGCPKCKYERSEVVETRNDYMRNIANRRRECLKCGHRFNTKETPAQPKRILDDRFERPNRT